jgi:hypothetical protein
LGDGDEVDDVDVADVDVVVDADVDVADVASQCRRSREVVQDVIGLLLLPTVRHADE